VLAEVEKQVTHLKTNEYQYLMALKFIIITISILSILISSVCNTSGDRMNLNSDTIKQDSMTYPVKIISVSINSPAEAVYQFASHPENFPKWVAFVESITQQGESWLAKTNIGDIKIKFTPQNDFGIIDHVVTMASGETVNNHMRVIRNNHGSEFTFTLFKMPGRTEEEFNDDAKAVTADLHKLKEIMERP
jgi:hypothetical protein